MRENSELLFRDSLTLGRTRGVRPVHTKPSLGTSHWGDYSEPCAPGLYEVGRDLLGEKLVFHQ